MPYTTPVTDRTLVDVIAKNSKAYLNVSDWTRIYNNSLEVNTLLASVLYPVVFFDWQLPLTSTVFDVHYMNAMLRNIERMRLWVNTYLSDYITDDEFIEIKDDWISGRTIDAPTFTNVNSWEKVLDIIYNLANSWVDPDVTGDWELVDGGNWELVGGGNWEHAA